MARARRRRNNEPQGWLERAAHKAGRVSLALAEGAGRRPKYAGKELSVVSSHVAMLAGYDAALDNPSELISTHGMSMIDEMRLNPTIHGIERGLFKAVLRRPGRFVPAKDDPEDAKQHAAFLNWNISNMDGSLKKALEGIGLAYCFGFTPTERILDSGPTPFGDRIYLKALKTRKPHDFAIHTDAHGNIRPKGLYQTIQGQEFGYDLNVGDGGGFILYVYDKEFDNHLGNTAFGAAYNPYFHVKWFIKFQAIGIEKFANAIPEITIDLEKTAEDYAASESAAKALLKGLQTNSEIILPNGFTLKYHELQGAGLQYIKDAILLHSGFIATAMLAPEHAGFTQVEGGSYAKADAQIDTIWMSVVDDMREDFCEDVLGDQLGRVLIDLNHGPQEFYPTFEFDPLTEDDKFEWLRAIVEAIKSGAIKWTVEREEALCERMGLPMLPEDLKKILTDAQVVPVGGGGADGTGGGGAAPDEDDAEDAGTPDAVKMAEVIEMGAGSGFMDAFPRDVFRMAEGRTKTRVRDDIETSAIDALAVVAKNVRDDLVARTEKILAMGEGKGNRYVSKQLRLKGAGDIRRILHATLLMATLQGKRDIRELIKKSKHTDLKLSETLKLAELSAIALIPAEVRKYFKGIPLAGSEAAKLAARAFDVAGGLTSQMLKEVQQVLYDGLKSGDARATRMELRRIFKGYLDTGELAEGKLLHPWRIETIVRNNTRDAYAQGRLRQLEDPDVAEIVVAYGNTVIYDDNTSETCESGMEGPFDKDDYVPPPYHHACRTEGPVPIFEGERHEIATFPHDTVAKGFDN